MIWHPQRIAPSAGQESVWDYPRPPRLEKIPVRLRVIFGGRAIADTISGYRVLETSHPPVYYLPPDDIARECLLAAPGTLLVRIQGPRQILVAGCRRQKIGQRSVELSGALSRICRDRRLSRVLGIPR